MENEHDIEVTSDDEALDRALAELRSGDASTLPEPELDHSAVDASVELEQKDDDSNELPADYKPSFERPVPGIFGMGKACDEKPEEDPVARRRRYTLFIIGGLIAVAIAGFLVYYLGFSRTTKTPDVVGMSSTEAVRALQESGLRLGSLTEQESPGVEEGSVIDQSPSADRPLRKGDPVNLVIAKVGSQTTVPVLTNKTQDEAQKLLTDARLTANIVETNSDVVAAGQVVGQLPVGNSLVSATSEVTVLVSRGGYTSDISVPKTLGLGQEEAEKLVSAQGLRPVTTYASTTLGTAGSVAAQTPASSSLVAPGFTVLMMQARDDVAAVVKVPEVVGQTKDQAVSTIVRSGLAVQSYLVADASTPAGSVSAQSPVSKDTLVKKGGTVALLISVGSGGAVTVPDVLDKPLSQAKSDLEAAGFNVIINNASEELGAQNSPVKQQFPAGRSTYHLGLPVILYAPAQN